MKRVLFIAGISLAVLTSGVAISACEGDNKVETSEAAIYQCPMDCEEGKTYDNEGICPVCEMELTVKEAGASEGHSH